MRASVRGFLGLGIACSVAVIVILGLRWEWSGDVWPYLVLPALTMTMCVVGLALPMKHQVNMALLLVSLVSSLYILDIVAAVLDRFSVPAPVGAVTGPNWVDRWLELIADLRDHDTLAYLPMPLVGDRSPIDIDGANLFPLSAGIGRVMTVLCNETGEFIRYVSDEFGFRNPNGLWNSGVDLMMIGDSYTQGVCVSDGQTVAGRLRHTWPKTLNLGVIDAGPLRELAILREYGGAVRPKTVLWLFFEGNDLANLEDEAEVPALRRYMEPGHVQGIREAQRHLDSALARHHDSVIMAPKPLSPVTGRNGWTRSLRGLLTLQNLRKRLGVSLSPPSASTMRMMGTVLENARSTVTSWGGRLYFVYLPTYARYASIVGSGVHGRAELLDLVQTLAIPLIDMNPVFSRQEDWTRLWWHRLSHYSDSGYALVTQTIREHLLRDGFLVTPDQSRGMNGLQ